MLRRARTLYCCVAGADRMSSIASQFAIADMSYLSTHEYIFTQARRHAHTHTHVTHPCMKQFAGHGQHAAPMLDALPDEVVLEALIEPAELVREHLRRRVEAVSP
jgi:hypothetical protein